MPEFISALDDQYISVKAAAQLIASERPELAVGELMDMFVHGIFSKEFEPPSFSPLRRDDANWMLHMRIERPLQDAAIRALPIEKQPHDRYAVGAMTVFQFLDGRRALPRDSAPSRESETERGRLRFIEPGASEKALATLASTSFSAFPETGRAILGEILMSRTHLRKWMLGFGHRLPKFLVKGEPESMIHQPVENGETDETESAAINGGPDDAASSNAERGRPPKAAWERIKQLVRDLHTKHPQKKRSSLAFEARREALKEFDEIHLPSEATIVGRMKDIIGT